MHNAASTSEFRGERSRMLKLKLKREVDNGVIFISSDEVSDLFLVMKESEAPEAIRQGIINVLKAAYEPSAQVFPNGKVDGPIIDVVVELKNH